MAEPLITASLLRQLEQLELLARRRSRSTSRGERRSKARGHSVEFADHRSYVPGDDFRYLDWNLFGRLDRLFVKLYEEERELPVEIFLDASESMCFGTPAKFDFARRIAAAVGYVALCGFDRVTIRVFPEPEASGRGANAGSVGNGGGGVGGERACRGALRGVRGRKSVLTFFQNLSRLTPGGAAEFDAALRRGALEVRRPGVAVVLSDVLDPGGYTAGLDALIGRGFHVHLVQILAREELEPTTFGDLRLVDSETNGEREVTFGKYRLKAYRQAVENYTQRLREFCQGRGIRFFRAASDTPIEALLLKELRTAGVLG